LTKTECFIDVYGIRFRGRFAPRSWGEASTGRIVYGANRPWGDSSSVGRNVRGETSVDVSPQVHGAKRLWANPHVAKCLVRGETSMGRNDHGAKRQYMGRNVLGANCQWGEKSINLPKRLNVGSHNTTRYDNSD